jgi:hypothetical protein
MFLSKVKFAAIVLLALGLVGSGAGFVVHRTGAEQPASQSVPVPGLPTATSDKAKKQDAEAQPDPPPPVVVEEKPTSRDRELRHLLDQPVRFSGFEDPKCTLNEVLEALAQRYNLSFDINEHAFKEAGIKEIGKFEPISPNPIPAMHTRLGTVLQKILSRVSPSATYIIRNDFIEITTVQAVRKEFFARRPNGPFPPLVTAHLNKVPLEAALKDLGRSNNVVLDSRANKLEGQAPVTADLTNVPLDTAVRLLADMADLRMVRLDNVFYVTTPENAKRLHEEQAKIITEHPDEVKPEKRPAPDKPSK